MIKTNLGQTVTNSRRERARKAYNKWRSQGEGRAFLCMLFSMNEGRCPNCGVEMILYFGESKNGESEQNRATLDHKIPLHITQEHDKNNLTLMCYRCNKDKAGEVSAQQTKKYIPSYKKVFV